MAKNDKALRLEDGPWDGMRDSVAPTSRKEGKLLLAKNVYPLDPNLGDGIVGRPGFSVLGSILGGSGTRRVQGFYQFTKKNGSEFTIAIVGGLFYTCNWTTMVWTEVVTTANLTSASITLDATAQIAFLTFNDTVLVSDGVNAPFTWDGTTNGGLTKLTNAPVFYGQPTMYAGRIFGIKASDRATMVWSETNAANTGYEAGGYNNSWTIAQTDSNQLFRLVGTNSAIYVLRARSATSVTGTVSSNFSSAATNDDVSSTEGTMSPFACLLLDQTLVVLDADYHVQQLRPGGGFDALWDELRETTKSLPRTSIGKAIAVNYASIGLLLFCVPKQGATECNQILVYDSKRETPVPVAVWDGFEITAMALVKNGSGIPVIIHGDSTGYVYLHGNPEDSVWSDGLVAGTAAISHVVETQPLGFDIAREKIFDRVDISTRSLSDMTFSVYPITPRGSANIQSLTATSSVIGWGTGLWGSMTWSPDGSSSTQEQHVDAGLDAFGRWVKLRIEHEVVGEQFGLVAIAATGYPTNDDPPNP